MTINVKNEALAESVVPGCERMDVTVNPDGSVTITADLTTAARLAGRTQFGDTERTRALLAYRIGCAWYDAGCPTEAGS